MAAYFAHAGASPGRTERAIMLGRTHSSKNPAVIDLSFHDSERYVRASIYCHVSKSITEISLGGE